MPNSTKLLCMCMCAPAYSQKTPRSTSRRVRLPFRSCAETGVAQCTHGRENPMARTLLCNPGSSQKLVCRYKALLAQREGSDSFVDGEAQTVEHLQKAKEVQCNTTSTESTEIQVRQLRSHMSFPESVASDSMLLGHALQCRMLHQEQHKACMIDSSCIRCKHSGFRPSVRKSQVGEP